MRCAPFSFKNKDGTVRKRFGEPDKDYCPMHLTAQGHEKTAAPECSESEILEILKQRPTDERS
jgi:hypothetical protein